MKKYGIVILQDNLQKAEEIGYAFDKSGDFEVLGKSADGEEGIRLLKASGAEFLLSDVILQNLDGLGVLDRIKEENLNVKTIIFSAMGSEEVVDACIEKGASFYVAKPCPAETLVKRVSELFLGSGTTGSRTFGSMKSVSPKKTGPSLDEKISKIFISVGIPPHTKGYSYLREGVKLAVEEPDVINNITKKLYPMIGEKYSTTPSKVERAIRHAIEVAWARGRINNINDLFGVQTYLAGEKPTNGEFIALIADKMLLEGA